MVIYHDPLSADYGSAQRPEQPARVVKTAGHLRTAHPEWEWRLPVAPAEDVLLLAHTPAHLRRLTHPPDLDPDTPYFDGIAGHATRSVGAALAAAEAALAGNRTFALMRPPGHHATASQAMGFCYLNQVAIAALYAQQRLGAARVAVWDFDAHHGNGTQALLHGRPDILFTSVHQLPGYPESGAESFDNCLNWPVQPQTPRAVHMNVLRESLDAVAAFAPDLILVSAGFDAYARDPLTSLSLEADDFATLGAWLHALDRPTAAILEGGYSSDLALLIDAFLSAWEKSGGFSSC